MRKYLWTKSPPFPLPPPPPVVTSKLPSRFGVILKPFPFWCCRCGPTWFGKWNLTLYVISRSQILNFLFFVAEILSAFLRGIPDWVRNFAFTLLGRGMPQGKDTPKFSSITVASGKGWRFWISYWYWHPGMLEVKNMYRITEHGTVLLGLWQEIQKDASILFEYSMKVETECTDSVQDRGVCEHLWGQVHSLFVPILPSSTSQCAQSLLWWGVKGTASF